MGLIHARQGQAALILVFALLVRVARRAHAFALEKYELRDPLVGVNLRRQGGGVADFQRDLAAPLWLDRRDVHDDSASRVCALADADRQVFARHRDMLDRLAQRKAVRRDEHVIAARLVTVDGDEASLREFFRIDNLGVHVREDLEDRAYAQVVAVAGNAKADLAGAFRVVLERLDADELTDLSVAEDSHDAFDLIGDHIR